MVLPKKVRQKRQTWKLCAHEGCNREFLGIPIAKFCKTHREPDFVAMRRTRKVSGNKKINPLCRHIPNKCQEDQDLMLDCATCGEMFHHVLPAKLELAPTHCPEHRTVYKREYYEKCKLRKVG